MREPERPVRTTSARSPTHLHIAGAVLAGGRSTRMGTDKARLVVDGAPLALRVAGALAAAGVDPVVITGKDPSLGELLPFVADPLPLAHPLVGVLGALRHFAQSDLVVCAACDLVGLDPPHVAALLAAGDEAVAVDPEGRPALLLALRPSRHPALAEALAAQTSVRSFVAGLPRVALRGRALANANTHDELDAALADRSSGPTS